MADIQDTSSGRTSLVRSAPTRARTSSPVSYTHLDVYKRQEIDSAYGRRCQKRLQEWGAPLSGWYCEYIYDVTDEEEDPDHIDVYKRQG